MNRIKEKRALISVSDRSGVIDLALFLVSEGYSILASDGTANHLESSGISALRIEEVTGAPELFNGRVKTLHPLIHGAILFDRSDSDQVAEAHEQGISPIDVVVVNLYGVEQFDIGGPALIRAAAKNHQSVSILTNPDQYQEFMNRHRSGITPEDRENWALAALETTARYDLAILRTKGRALRYGENPHQSATLVGSFGVAGARILQGKAPSYNNYLDMDIATLMVSDHPRNTFVIVKHAMACGIATDGDSHAALTKAIDSDPVSAFGGVVAANCEIDKACAEEISKGFFEVISAPSFSEEALSILAEKKNLRLALIESRVVRDFLTHEIDGGFLFQEPDHLPNPEIEIKFNLVAGPPLNPESMKDLQFAWRSVARIRSNAILIAKNEASVGIGMGEVNRLAAASSAVKRAGNRAIGAVAASDGFFPFPDGLKVLVDAGVSGIVAPGGSIRDESVIGAAVEAGVSLYFAAERHFSHN